MANLGTAVSLLLPADAVWRGACLAVTAFRRPDL
jgi:hypothetical protein